MKQVVIESSNKPLTKESLKKGFCKVGDRLMSEIIKKIVNDHQERKGGI